jgi:outer membrane protein TolC
MTALPAPPKPSDGRRLNRVPYRPIDLEPLIPHNLAAMCVRILVGIALCAAVMAVAQTAPSQATPRSLSLQQCIQLALTHNLDVQIGRLSTDIARFNLSGAYGAYDPILSFRATHADVSQPGDFDPQKFNPDFPYQLTTDSVAPALEGLLPIGMSYSFNGRAGHKSATTDFNSDPDDAGYFFWGVRETNNFFGEAGVTARQHLLRDFWIDQPREVLRVRRKESKMTEQALRFQIARILLAVELGYYDLIATREQVRVEEKALELKQQFVAETRRRVEVGDLPALDAEQAETQLQNTLTALTAAREAYVARQNALKTLLTDDFREWVDTDLLPTDALLALAPDVHRSESFQNALECLPDLAEARLAVEKSDVVVQFQRNQLYPSLDFVGHYGGLGVAENSGAAVSDTFHFRNPEYFYGVVLSFPLTRTAERNYYRASQAARQIAKLQLKKAEQGIFLEIADWVNRVQSRFTQVGSTHRARAYAEAALAAEQKKLQNGLSTSFFVLQLQETLTTARTAEALALADYNKALAQLAFAEGSMLDRHHFTVEVK